MTVFSPSSDNTRRIIATMTEFHRQFWHAIFSSEKAAIEWLSIQCGALDNQSPTDFVKETGNFAEVERILNSIDHGMIA